MIVRTTTIFLFLICSLFVQQLNLCQHLETHTCHQSTLYFVPRSTYLLCLVVDSNTDSIVYLVVCNVHSSTYFVLGCTHFYVFSTCWSINYIFCTTVFFIFGAWKYNVLHILYLFVHCSTVYCSTYSVPDCTVHSSTSFLPGCTMFYMYFIPGWSLFYKFCTSCAKFYIFCIW